jgi:hypothetical protein
MSDNTVVKSVRIPVLTMKKLEVGLVNFQEESCCFLSLKTQLIFLNSLCYFNVDLGAKMSCSWMVRLAILILTREKDLVIQIINMGVQLVFAINKIVSHF